jgi:hypothetical protein
MKLEAAASRPRSECPCSVALKARLYDALGWDAFAPAAYSTWDAVAVSALDAATRAA